MNHPTITTQRFVLKVLTESLVTETYRGWFHDETVKNFIEYSKPDISLSDLKAYVVEKYKSPKTLFFGIFLPLTNEHIGNIKFEPICFESREAVMGILIGSQEWRGRGVFEEVMSSLAPNLKELGILKIWLGVKKLNHAAIRAYEKNGFAISENESLISSNDDSLTMVKHI